MERIDKKACRLFLEPVIPPNSDCGLLDSSGNPYKNGRNLAAGSIRLLKSEDCRERRVTFMPFNVLEGFDELPAKSERLKQLRGLGFHPCYYLLSKHSPSPQEMEAGIQKLRDYARDNDIPIDGIVATYNDVAFAKTCGRTGHHYKDGLAFKFEDETFETKLTGIEWNPTRTGVIAPVAILRPVQIDGATVSRASLGRSPGKTSGTPSSAAGTPPLSGISSPWTFP